MNSLTLDYGFWCARHDNDMFGYICFPMGSVTSYTAWLVRGMSSLGNLPSELEARPRRVSIKSWSQHFASPFSCKDGSSSRSRVLLVVGGLWVRIWREMYGRWEWTSWPGRGNGEVTRNVCLPWFWNPNLLQTLRNLEDNDLRHEESCLSMKGSLLWLAKYQLYFNLSFRASGSNQQISKNQTDARPICVVCHIASVGMYLRNKITKVRGVDRNVISSWRVVSSSTETVEAVARALESMDNVQSTNGLPGKYISTGRRIRYRPPHRLSWSV